MSGAFSRVPWSATAITVSAFQPPLAKMFVPSRGSTATSTRGPYPFPSFSPIYSIGASSISPSPITTVPFIGTVSKTSLIALVAASSASSFFPGPSILLMPMPQLLSHVPIPLINFFPFQHDLLSQETIMNFEAVLFLRQSFFHAKLSLQAPQASSQGCCIRGQYAPVP